MATIHVNRGGTNLGTFSEDEIRKGLGEKRFLLTDLGWREGMPSWQPLSQWPEFASAAAATPPAGAVPPLAGASAAAGTAPGDASAPAEASIPPVAPPVLTAADGA